MASQIDATKPTEGQAFTVDVRDNFAYAKSEIEALQADVATLKARASLAASQVTANPPNTNSSVMVLAGVGIVFNAPSGVTRAVVFVTGDLGNTTNGAQSHAQLVLGTGTSPGQGTVVSATNGALLDIPTNFVAQKANDFSDFTTFSLLVNLTPAAQYWLDVGYSADSGAATLSEMQVVVFSLIDATP